MSRALSMLGMSDPAEALLCLPAEYLDLREAKTRLGDGDDIDGPQLFHLRISGRMRGFERGRKEPLRPTFQRKTFRLEVDLFDDRNQSIVAQQFGNVWGWKDVTPDAYIHVRGVPKRFGKLYLTETEVIPITMVGHVVARYKGIPGRIAGDTVNDLVANVINDPEAYDHAVNAIIGGVGMSERDALEYCGLEDAGSLETLLRAIHRPDTPEQGLRARAAATKLTALGIQASAMRRNTRQNHRDAPIRIRKETVTELKASQKEATLGYTDDQETCIDAICESLGGPRPANILLSGDVGTGKTLTYLIPAVAAYAVGAKIAIMAPTQILANQLAAQIVQRFPKVPAQRVEAGGTIRDDGSILVGTTGLISSAKKAKWVPDVLIVDEQHKMSAEMRSAMAKDWTHVIEVSATPIPRTMALSLYNGMQVLSLRQCPVKKTIHSAVIEGPDGRRNAAREVAAAIETGGRAIFIYPRVKSAPARDDDSPFRENGDESAEILDDGTVEETPKARANLLESAETLRTAYARYFGRDVVAVIHGGLSPEEKVSVIASVKSGEKPLLVASSIVEIGIDIPDMRVMVVRDASNFGINQLHQMRGRLARNGGEGKFFMYEDDLETLTAEGRQRLQALSRISSGFDLAEIDTTMRGFGNLDEGDLKQSGRTQTLFRFTKIKPADFLRMHDKTLEIDPGDSDDIYEPTAEQARLF